MALRNDVGAMRRRAKIQRPSASPTGFELVEEVPGALDFLSGATVESIVNGAPTAMSSWRWMLRYRSDLKSEYRIEDAEDGRVFQIHGFGDPDGKKSRIFVFCTELQ